MTGWVLLENKNNDERRRKNGRRKTEVCGWGGVGWGMPREFKSKRFIHPRVIPLVIIFTSRSFLCTTLCSSSMNSKCDGRDKKNERNVRILLSLYTNSSQFSLVLVANPFLCRQYNVDDYMCAFIYSVYVPEYFAFIVLI